MLRAMRHPSTRISLDELCAATGEPADRIEHLRRRGIVRPEADGHYTVENILEVTLAAELTKVRFRSHQQAMLAAQVRAAIAHLSPAARMVARYRHYIKAVVHLAAVFGCGPTYDTWLATQRKQLGRMEKALARAGDDAGPALDTRLLDLFMAALPAADEPPALAG